MSKNRDCMSQSFTPLLVVPSISSNKNLRVRPLQRHEPIHRYVRPSPLLFPNPSSPLYPPLTPSSLDRPLRRRSRLQPAALPAPLQPRNLGRVGHRPELEDARAARLRHAVRRTARWRQDFQAVAGARQGVWEEGRGG